MRAQNLNFARNGLRLTTPHETSNIRNRLFGAASSGLLRRSLTGSSRVRFLAQSRASSLIPFAANSGSADVRDGASGFGG